MAGFSPYRDPQADMMALQTKILKQKQKQSKTIFDALLGQDNATLGGPIGNLLGGLTGGGGMGGAGGMGGGMTPGTGVLPRFQQTGGGGGGLGSASVAGNLATAAVAYGGGQREALQEQFNTARQNALGQLEMRGLGGSSLVGPTLGAVERQRNLASGELEDRLFREQLQFRAAERAPMFGLLGQLLGGLGV